MFHTLIRLHTKAKRVTLQSRANNEAVKARRMCAKSVQLFKDRGDVVSPSFSQAEAERYFTRVYQSDPNQFDRPGWLPPPTPPASILFNEGCISIREVQQAITRLRSSSSPSLLDRISYLMLKNCPSVISALVDIFNTWWTSASVPQA